MRVDSETTKHSKNEVVRLTGGLRGDFEVGREAAGQATAMAQRPPPGFDGGGGGGAVHEAKAAESRICGAPRLTKFGIASYPEENKVKNNISPVHNILCTSHDGKKSFWTGRQGNFDFCSSFSDTQRADPSSVLHLEGVDRLNSPQF